MPFVREITVYQAFCPKPRVAGECKAGEEVGYPLAVKPSTETQTVVYWTVGNDTPPSKHEHCAVRDTKNWSCHAQSNQGFPGYDWTMVDGRYDEKWSLPEGLPTIYYQVPKYRYYLIRLNQGK